MNLHESIKAATNDIIKNGCSDITKENLERNIIEKYRECFIEHLLKILNEETINLDEIFPIEYLLTPKGRYIFDNRKAAILDPIANACFLSTVLQYSEAIESKRIPKEKNIIFSYRLKISDKGLFDKDVNYGTWKIKNKEKINSNEHNFIVKTDISGFYDRVNTGKIIEKLENINIDEKLIEKTKIILNHCSNNKSYGLPVGNNASRILAEVYLIDIDQYLLDQNIEFTRYVDDYRFFTKSFLEAQNALNKLNLRLFEDGLSLNSQKTSIKKISDDTIENADKHHENQAFKVFKEVIKLQGGYNKVIKKFYMPSDKNLEIYIKEDIQSLKNQIIENEICSIEEIQRLILSIIIQKKYQHLRDVCKIIKSNIFSLDYFIDMLIKNADAIPSLERNAIVNYLNAAIYNKELNGFPWQLSLIAKLFGTSHYKSLDGLILIINTEEKQSSYATTIALEGLDENISKDNFLAISKKIDLLNQWQQRRIIYLSRKITNTIKQEWIQSISHTIGKDFFIQKLLTNK